MFDLASRGVLHAERGSAASKAFGRTTPPISIAIDAVTIPELVDRPQFVLRTGATQVTIDEYARWADPLRSQISRVLAADLARAVPGALVSGFAQHSDSTEAYRVRVDVQSFESAPGEAAAMVVLWSVRPPKQSTAISGPNDRA